MHVAPVLAAHLLDQPVALDPDLFSVPIGAEGVGRRPFALAYQIAQPDRALTLAPFVDEQQRFANRADARRWLARPAAVEAGRDDRSIPWLPWRA